MQIFPQNLWLCRESFVILKRIWCMPSPTDILGNIRALCLSCNFGNLRNFQKRYSSSIVVLTYGVEATLLLYLYLGFQDLKVKL